MFIILSSSAIATFTPVLLFIGAIVLLVIYPKTMIVLSVMLVFLFFLCIRLAVKIAIEETRFENRDAHLESFKELVNEVAAVVGENYYVYSCPHCKMFKYDIYEVEYSTNNVVAKCLNCSYKSHFLPKTPDVEVYDLFCKLKKAKSKVVKTTVDIEYTLNPAMQSV